MGVRFCLSLLAIILSIASAEAQITVQSIRAVPAFRQILISAYINPGTNTQAALTVTYRQQGAPAWTAAHPGAPSTNDPYWLSTAIFDLSEATAYEIHAVVTDPGGVTNGDQSFVVQTRSTAAPVASGSTYHVSPTGHDDTGDGSAGNPWQSLTRADSSAAPGDTILVHGGTYPVGETISVHSGSQAGGYIVYKAAPGETPVFDGSDPLYTIPNSGNHFLPVAGRAGVYSTTPGYEPAYVAAGTDRLYNYAFDDNNALDSLTSGIVTHNGTSYAVAGWLYQSGTLYVHLAGGVDPDTVSMHIAQAGSAIQIYNTDYIAVQGLTVRYSDVAFRLRGDHEATAGQPAGRYAWIDGNTIEYVTSTGISTIGWISCGAPVSTDASIGAPGAVLIRNAISDAANTAAWPWDIKKGSDAENSAINLEAGDGAIVRDNAIHDIFNGVGASNWGDCFWGGFPLESAGMNRNAVVEKNTMADIGDDMLEPEGAIINFVIQENKGLRLHTGISVAPIGEGPVWVLRNEVVDYVEGCMKYWDGLDVNRGWIFVFHNTFVTRLAGSAAMLVYPDSSHNVKVRIRNNIFQGTQMAVDAGDPNWGSNVSLDYDDYYSSTGYIPAVMWYYQGTVTCPSGGTNDHCWYDSVAEWINDSANQGQPQEQHGKNLDPTFVDVIGGDFRLADSSTVIDQGVVIPGINTNYMGTAPDPGAYESTGAPPNDDCAFARVIGSTPYTDPMDTSLATQNPADPAPCAGVGNNSVWYRYTPPADATVTADTFGSTYDTVLSVWSGACGSLSAVQCNNDSGGAQSEVSFSATAGTAYYFQVSDAGSGGGSLLFHVTSTFSYLFFDDFEDGVSTGWTHKKGTWAETSGELRGTTGRKSDDIATAFTAGCTMCTVEAYMRVEPGARASLLAWFTDKRNLVELMMAEDRDKWIFKQKVNGRVVAKKPFVGSIDPNLDYKARITFDGSQFHVFIDDLSVLDVAPGAVPSGTVGFRVKSLTRLNETAAFRQIAVWQ